MTVRLPRRPARAGEPGRPLSATAALGGAMAVAITLVLCMSLALISWFLADAGAHGQTTDALRVGADHDWNLLDKRNFRRAAPLSCGMRYT